MNFSDSWKEIDLSRHRKLEYRMNSGMCQFSQNHIMIVGGCMKDINQLNKSSNLIIETHFQTGDIIDIQKKEMMVKGKHEKAWPEHMPTIGDPSLNEIYTVNSINKYIYHYKDQEWALKKRLSEIGT